MKILLFLCRCGPHIAGHVDLDAVAERAAARHPGLLVRSVDFACSEEGRSCVRAELLRERPDRVVLGACSPRDHEETFRLLLEEAGINRHLLQMANIREQVAWTSRGEEATERAAAAVAAAVNRVALHRPRQRRQTGVNPDVLILGGGPAGLSAARTLAAAGRRVVLAEKSGALGGAAIRLASVAPSGECGSCLLVPLLEELLHGDISRQVEILTLARPVAAKGRFGAFTVDLEIAPRHVAAQRCLGCGACVAACPALSGSGGKAIDFPFPGALPSVPWLDEETCLRWQGEDCSACRDACPVSALELEEPVQTVSRDVGGVVVAVGADYRSGAGEDREAVPPPRPAPDLPDLARLLGTPLEKDGFFRLLHPTLETVRSIVRGFYPAGSCSGARGLRDALLQGQAAAGALLADLREGGVVELETETAEVEPRRCSGCRVCLRACPYAALEADRDGKITVNELLCRACGSCAAACPAAISQHHWTREQLEAELAGGLP